MFYLKTYLKPRVSFSLIPINHCVHVPFWCHACLCVFAKHAFILKKVQVLHLYHMYLFNLPCQQFSYISVNHIVSCKLHTPNAAYQMSHAQIYDNMFFSEQNTKQKWTRFYSYFYVLVAHTRIKTFTWLWLDL